MATITYGSEDAIYGSGVYNLAVYGEYGPTLLIDGVSSSSSVGTFGTSAKANTTLVGLFTTGAAGTLETSAKANTTLVGISSTSSVGFVQVNTSEVLTGVQITGSVGSFTFVAEANKTITGAQAVASEGIAQASGDALQNLTGVSGTLALGTVVISATTGLTGQQLNSFVGNVQVDIVEYIAGVVSTAISGSTEESGSANQTLDSVSAEGSAGDTSETAVVFNFEAVKETYGRKRTVILSRAA